MTTNPFQTLVLSVALALMVGWLLVIGQALLLPVFTAIIAVYILTSCAAAIGRLPVMRHFPLWLLHALVLSAFTLIFIVMGGVVAVTVRQLFEVAPTYQSNLETLITSVAQYFGAERDPNWDDIRAVTVDQISLPGLLATLLSSLTSLGATVFLVVVYAGFLLAERGSFAKKLAAAFPAGDQALRTGRMIAEINRKIGDYLAVKTGINVILGCLSYAVLWFMDVDFALFWAVVIAMMNYIPYVGSLIGVAFPVLLSLAQFGSFGTTLLLAVLLTGAQTYVGNILEPRLIGRSLNLSPFVVLLALSFWSTIWGLPGAILAIPMTSVLVILFTAFPSTRFVAVLLAETPEHLAAEVREAAE